MNEEEDDVVYQEENQYFEEDIYEAYEDAEEYIEVDGRLVVHQPVVQSTQPSTSSQATYRSTMVPGQKMTYTQSIPEQMKVKQEGTPSSSAVHMYTDEMQMRRPPNQMPKPSLISTIPNSSVKLLAVPNWNGPPPAYYGKQVEPKPILAPMAQPIYTSSTVVYESQGKMKNYEVMAEQLQQHNMKKKKKQVAPGQRKPCNCTKSQCLKLYCDCFANGEFCTDCNCKDCHNNIEFEGARSKAVRQSLDRNPNAFKPKIGIARAGAIDIERLHQKGCHCKKSGCLKNYCECYEAKVPCTDRCKCKGCQNTESYRMARYKPGGGSANALMSLANAASSVGTSDSRPSSVVTEDMNEEYDDMNYPSKPAQKQDPRKFPWIYMTDEVVEATTLCMVAQAEEVLSTSRLQKTGMSQEEQEIQMERLILREFGKCLEQIISNASDSCNQ